MKEALSISIGSSIRNKTVIVNLLGEEVRISRIATDGDMNAAREKFRELDGQVDAFGVGGTDLGLFMPTGGIPSIRCFRSFRMFKSPR